jgi:glycine dehydrogenase subunit 2
MEKLIFEKSRNNRHGYTMPILDVESINPESKIPGKFLRKSPAPLPEVSENEIVRHFIRLSQLNYNIDEGFYPLGSCTMKYNPKVNEKTASLSGFADLHPCSEDKYAQGALELMHELGEYLKEITGLQGVSLQPAAGSQGELTGILVFRAYHLDKRDFKRTKILIPDSAHGTNPASAAIGGYQIVSVKSNDRGGIDIDDLKSKAGDDVAGMMITNPSTLGLFERDIQEIVKIVKDCGGLLYMDGANLNALLGIVRPGDMGFDCVHINLHKTFSTPHGGGGPGSGPICVSEKLVQYLPVPQIVKEGDNFRLILEKEKSIGRVHSFFGNFGVFVRALTYMKMLGADGMRGVSENAIINANYLFSLLKDHFTVPYDEFCMHEFVLSGDKQKENGVSTKDVAKRLLDYGFHAPTIYFPLIVHESLLIEPTETESMENLDSFAEAMIKIAEEAKQHPELLLEAPHVSPVRRVDDALAARKLNISWFQPE